MERIPKILETIDAGLVRPPESDLQAAAEEFVNAEIDSWHEEYNQQEREQMKRDYKLRGRLPEGVMPDVDTAYKSPA